MKSILIIFYLISISFCLKLNLIDNYFVKVYIGDSQTEFKLLVDLTYSFSYILKSYESNSKKEIGATISPISNIYGNYTGLWYRDIFHFKENNITIQMKFLEVINTSLKQRKYNFLNVDGVLGLGLYDYLEYDRTIFYSLKDCSNNITIYDRINQQILLCESNIITKKSKKISLPLDNKNIVINHQGVVDISKIIVKEKELNLTTNTFIGLLPLFITSKDADDWIIEENKKSNSNINNKNLALDNKLSYKIFFVDNDNDLTYENKEKDIKYIKSFLDLKEMLINFKNIYLENMYLGLDKNYIEKVVIDYNQKRVNIFTKCYIYLIIRVILFILTTGFFIYILISVLKKKKSISPINENEQELIDM